MSTKRVLTDYLKSFARLGAACLALLILAAVFLVATKGWGELVEPRNLRLALGTVLATSVGAAFMVIEGTLARKQKTNVS